MANLNWVDFIILAIFLSSTLAGLFRGLVREILAVFTWIGAFIIAVLFSSKVASLFTASAAGKSVISGTTTAIGANTTESISLVSLGLSFVCLFLLTLIIGSLISSLLSQAAESTGVGFANKLFGSIFGFIRGFLINLVIVFTVQLTSLDSQDAWKKSTLVPVFLPAAVWLGDLVHPGLESLKTAFGRSVLDVKSVFQFRG